MLVVIIAGGSGTRLWPLSTPDYPKHLLKLTDNSSLLENTLDRVKRLTARDQIYVVSESSHVKHVYKHLDGLNKNNVLVEAARRGTASCVALALSEIKKRGQTDEPILFIWADHLIRDNDGFVATILKAGEIAVAQQKLVFIGIEPTYPSTGLGYMQRKAALKQWRDVYELAEFKEKPDKKTAERYLTSGQYLWNTGYLVGTLETFEREMKDCAPALWSNYQKLLDSKNQTKTYLTFEPEAIDTALSEKIKDGLVVPGNFDWLDVGSFKVLHSISLQDDNGNHVKGGAVEIESTTNSYVRNETNHPVIVIGLDNVIVVNTDHGVLVTNTNYSQKVGEISKRL